MENNNARNLSRICHFTIHIIEIFNHFFPRSPNTRGILWTSRPVFEGVQFGFSAVVSRLGSPVEKSPYSNYACGHFVLGIARPDDV